MPQPTREDWLKISMGFKDSVDFPNCIGALDGKHFRVKKPPNSGSRYRPYPRRSIDNRKQYFNYRLTKARRYVECAFGILANKWRIYHTTIQLQPNSVKSVIKATIVLHNFCRIHEGGTYVDDESQINHVVNPTGEPMSHNSVTSGLQIRKLFTDYFNFFDANNIDVC
ncbi:uncharacterized protein ACNLHF_004934 [Anomaloglossus baeobatrachus]